MGVEKKASFYDVKFETEVDYHIHYKESWYYVHWTQIIKYLKKIPDPAILEVGCGTGQLAYYLYDEGHKKYVGFDFSRKAIEIAKQNSDISFFVGNALDKDSYAHEYNTVICTEVLEHIDNDIDVIMNFKNNAYVIFSVPDFDEVSHVRWFTSERKIKKRYFKYIDIKYITRVGNIFIVLGVRSNFQPNVFQYYLASRESVSLGSFWIRIRHKIKNWFMIKSI